MMMMMILNENSEPPALEEHDQEQQLPRFTSVATTTFNQNLHQLNSTANDVDRHVDDHPVIIQPQFGSFPNASVGKKQDDDAAAAAAANQRHDDGPSTPSLPQHHHLDHAMVQGEVSSSVAALSAAGWWCQQLRHHVLYWADQETRLREWYQAVTSAAKSCQKPTLATTCVVPETLASSSSSPVPPLPPPPPPPLIMIAGPLGSGKTLLARSVLRDMCHRRSANVGDGANINATTTYVLLGTCDWLQRPEPYRVLITALDGLAQQVQMQSVAERERISYAVRRAIPEPQVLIDMIPSLAPLFHGGGANSSLVANSIIVQQQKQQQPRQDHQHQQQNIKKCECADDCPLKLSPDQEVNDAHGPLQQSSIPGNGRTPNSNNNNNDSDSIQRFPFLLRTLLQAIASSSSSVTTTTPQHQPHAAVVILWLEDIHRADPCTLDLLGHIVTIDLCSRTKGLFIVGSYETATTTTAHDDHCGNSPVPTNSYLAKILRDMEQSWGSGGGCGACGSIILPTIVLRQLHLAEVEQWVAAAWRLPFHDAQSLARTVWSHSHGNVLATIALLQAMMEERKGLLWDVHTQSWTWHNNNNNNNDDPESNEDLQTLLRETADNPIDRRLASLSSSTCQVLQVASCLGPQLDLELLELIVESKSVVQESIVEASSCGLLSNNPVTNHVSFAHDVVQKEIYYYQRQEWQQQKKAEVDEEDEDDDTRSRELLHVGIARRLWHSLEGIGSNNLERHIFVVVSQILLGHNALKRQDERNAWAHLCLLAGTKAAQSSSFRMAAIYLRLGIRLLGGAPGDASGGPRRQHRQCWREDYDLSLALHNACAEMMVCTAEHDDVGPLLDAVINYARAPQDKFHAYSTKIYALSNAGRQQDALDLTMFVLESLKEGFPKRFRKLRLLSRWKSLNRKLQNMTNEQILGLPPMQNAEKIVCMKILNLAFVQSLISQPQWTPFISTKLVQLTLDYGQSVFSSVAFSMFGVTCCSLGDLDGAYRYGELGLHILRRTQVREYMPRVHMAFYGLIWPWKKPYVDAIEPLTTGYRVGTETGDIEFSSFCLILGNLIRIDSTSLLPEIDHDWRAFRGSATTGRQEFHLLMGHMSIHVVHQLMGRTPLPLSFQGRLIETDDLDQFCQDHGYSILRSIVFACRIMAAYVFCDYQLATRLVAALPKGTGAALSVFVRAGIVFFSAMVVLAVPDYKKLGLRQKRVVQRALKSLQALSLTCPENFSDRLSLLEAEIASTRGQSKVAKMKYNCAIALAKDWDHHMIHGLSCERAGRRLFEWSSMKEALTYFQRAHEAYTTWGAKAKADQMQESIDAITRSSSFERSWIFPEADT